MAGPDQRDNNSTHRTSPVFLILWQHRSAATGMGGNVGGLSCVLVSGVVCLTVIANSYTYTFMGRIVCVNNFSGRLRPSSARSAFFLYRSYTVARCRCRFPLYLAL